MAVTKDTRYVDLYKNYEQGQRTAYNDQLAAMRSQLATSKANVANNYDQSAAANYVNYIRQRNALPEQLAALGINGGASESAGVRMANNYAAAQSSNTASRNAAMGQLQNSFDTNAANMRNTLNQNLNDQYMRLAQAQIEYQDTLNERDFARFQSTVPMYQSADAINKAIKNLDKKDPNYASKKAMLQGRKSEIKAETKAKKQEIAEQNRYYKYLYDSLKAANTYTGGGYSGGGGTYYVPSTSSYSSGSKSSGSKSKGKSSSKGTKKVVKKVVTNVPNVTRGVVKTTNKIKQTVRKNKGKKGKVNTRVGLAATKW
jgi:hypothetical protein